MCVCTNADMYTHRQTHTHARTQAAHVAQMGEGGFTGFPAAVLPHPSCMLSRHTYWVNSASDPICPLCLVSCDLAGTCSRHDPPKALASADSSPNCPNLGQLGLLSAEASHKHPCTESQACACPDAPSSHIVVLNLSKFEAIVR